MPLFQFHCNCGLSFEELVSDREQQTHDCPDCGEEAEREVQDFSFRFEGRGDGDVAETTGVDEVDNDIDKIIGRDADRRWEEVKDRESKKRKVDHQTDQKTSFRRSSSPSREPDYGKMPEDEVEYKENMIDFYSDMYQGWREQREEEGIPRFEDEEVEEEEES